MVTWGTKSTSHRSRGVRPAEFGHPGGDSRIPVWSLLRGGIASCRRGRRGAETPVEFRAPAPVCVAGESRARGILDKSDRRPESLPRPPPEHPHGRAGPFTADRALHVGPGPFGCWELGMRIGIGADARVRRGARALDGVTRDSPRALPGRLPDRARLGRLDTECLRSALAPRVEPARGSPSWLDGLRLAAAGAEAR